MQRKLSIIAIAMGLSPLAFANTPLFEAQSPLPTPSQISIENNLSSEDRHLYSTARINTQGLTALTAGEPITINLFDTSVEGKIANVFYGANGSTHYVVKSKVHNIPTFSLITLGKTGAYMELVTEKGVYSAAGSPDTVLIHKPSDLYKAKGISFESDAISYAPHNKVNKLANKQRFIEQINQKNPLRNASTASRASVSTTITDQNGASNKPVYKASSDNGDIATIDILVVYSANSVDVVDDVTAKIDHFIAYTNQAYEASGIFAKVQLKGIVEVDYPYNDGRTGLYDIADGTPPFENIVQKRTEVGADAVALLTPQNEGDFSAGIAFQLSHLNSSSYDSMYSQTDINSSASTFAHELGHNLGLGHSRAQGESGSDFEYGVGYRLPIPGGPGFATVMAYDISDAGTIPYFSNPSNLCGVLPCGLPKEDQNFGADAVHAVNAVRHVVENYSDSVTNLLPIDEALAGVVDDNLKQCIVNYVQENTRFNTDISYFYCSSTVNSLDGLENFPGLTGLSISNIEADDLSPLESLQNLNYLTLWSVTASDFSFLKKLPNLQSLEISSDTFSNDQALHIASLTKLQNLYLSNSALTSLPDLSALTFLNSVTLYAGLQNIDAFANSNMLTQFRLNSSGSLSLPENINWPLLQTLQLSNTGLDSIDLLSSFSNLEELDVSGNNLDDISVLTSMTSLERLNLSRNNISDISSLADFSRLTELRLSNNPITDLSVLQEKDKLRVLDISYIDASDLSPIGTLTELEELSAGKFGVVYDWSFIEYMDKLTHLSLYKVNTQDLIRLEASKETLTDLSINELNAKDLSPLFQHYRLRYLTLAPEWNTSFYCWQVTYLNSVAASYSTIAGTCDASDDTNDYDGDGVSNIDELNAQTNPLENDTLESSVAFTIDSFNLFEKADAFGNGYTAVVKRSGDSTQLASVAVNVVDGTASSGSDFYATDKTLEFAAGRNFATFDVRVRDDFIIEGEETLTLSLSDPLGTEVGTPSELTLTINDDVDGSDFLTEDNTSATPSIKWGSLYTAANERDTETSIVVNRPEALEGAFTVDVSAVALSENAIDTFELNTSVLSFDATDEFKTVTVSFLDDDIDTASRFIALRLENPSTSLIDPEYASLTLEVKDDESVTNEIQFAQNYFRVQEDVGTVELELIRTKPDTVDREFSIYDRNYGSASLGEDATFATQTFIFPADKTSITVPLTIIDDDIIESLEILDLKLGGLTDEMLGANDFVSIYIDDNDGESSVISFESEQSSIGEGETFVSVFLTRTGNLRSQVDVRVYTTVGSASDEDFFAEDKVVTFFDSETTVQFNVLIKEDYLLEGDETFTITIDDSYQNLGDYTDHTVTIVDNDEPTGTISFSESAIEVNESTDEVEIILQRDGGEAGPIAVNITAIAGSASAQDYSFAAQQVVFNEGETLKQIALTIFNDEIEELTETLTLELSSDDDNVLGEVTTMTVSIIDDDEPAAPAGTLGFAQNRITVGESRGALELTVSRAGGTYGELSAQISAQSNTASSSDFTFSNTTVTFADGETEKTVTVQITDDSEEEAQESFSLALTGVNGTEISGNDTITITITDDDKQTTVNDTVGSSGGGGSSSYLLLLLALATYCRRVIFK